jgi:hypothetical protein
VDLSWQAVVSSVLLPGLKVVAGVAAGVLVGNLIEASSWTHALARLARPVARLGRFCEVSAASFAVAFVSGYTANTLLATAYQEGRIHRTELVLSNIFNSLPTYFVHLPSMAFLTIPLLGKAAAVYLSITVGAALLRTVGVLGVARWMLGSMGRCSLEETQLPQAPQGLPHILRAAWRRFQRRITKILAITLPVYFLFRWLQALGAFGAVEGWLTKIGASWLAPQAMSIVLFQMAAEFSGGIAAAGALLDTAALPEREVVLALVVGNILSSPMRAFRHQFPYYAGIFRPALAAVLISVSQGIRVVSLALCGAIYAWWTA